MALESGFVVHSKRLRCPPLPLAVKYAKMGDSVEIL